MVAAWPRRCPSVRLIRTARFFGDRGGRLCAAPSNVSWAAQPSPGRVGVSRALRRCPSRARRRYHQGTVGGWLMGPFVLAHLRVYQDRNAALRFLEPLGKQITSHGLGTLSEIFDGEAWHANYAGLPPVCYALGRPKASSIFLNPDFRILPPPTLIQHRVWNWRADVECYTHG